jgi:phospholipid transport system transporter-binding protein
MDASSVNSVSENLYEVVGKMTFTTVPGLLKQSKEKFDSTGAEVVFDLAKVRHADSAGLALMLEWLRLAKVKEKKIKFVKIPAQLLNLTEITGLSNILTQSNE